MGETMNIGTISAIGRPFGLAFASGINAYLPTLAFAVASRWFHLFGVNPNFVFITQNWCIAVLVVLTVVDFVADKIPLVDHVWNAVHKLVRPVMGAIVAAASFGRVPAIGTVTTGGHELGMVVAAVSDTHVIEVGLLVVLVIGGLLAAMSHTAKTTTRWVSTFTTAGFFNIVLSAIEDVMVFIAILLALFVPLIMLIVIVVFVLVVGPRLLRTWRGFPGRRWL
jgi:hypothetical protein